jgi:hypothetical protein
MGKKICVYLNMTTVNAFNTLLREFIAELAESFPEHEKLQLALATLDGLVKALPSKPMQLFMDALGPHSGLIMARDDSLFEQDIDIGGSLDLKEIWNTEGLSQNTRDAIWQYISTLYLLGNTVQHIPSELLSSIETVAQNCASQIESGQLNMADMTSSLLQSMSGLMQQQQHQQNRKNNNKKRLT